MKIEKLPSGNYRARKMYNGKMHRISFDHKPSEREIAAWVYELTQDNVAAKDTFRKCAENYIENRKNVLSPASVRTYNNFVKVISSNLLSKSIFDITQEDIQKEINSYSKDHAPKSVRSLHGFISSVFGSYRPSFTLATTLPQKEVKRPYRPNKSDIDRILEYETNGKYYIPFKLGVLGLRRGEVCALTNDDLKGNSLHVSKTKVYDGKNWIIKKNPKTDKSNRIIPLSEQLVSEMKQYGIEFDGSPKLLNTELHRACKSLGIEQFNFHSLRRYFASYASTLGLPEQDIMELGGWESDFVFKRIYRETMSDSVKNSAKKIMDNIF